jgi:deazaflavin-dependent oxidoreductase (nitroreductase family)
MGLQDRLGFRLRRANRLQRLMQRVASTRAGSWVFQRTLYRLDRPLYRWTAGRVTVPGLVAGLPVVLLTTTGARTGQARTMPLAGIPVGEDLAVIGSNYAQRRTPGWVHNLEAEPRATVTWHDAEVPVRARATTPEETEQVWDAASQLYSGFAAYRHRITHRPVRVFVLEPVE